MRHLTLTRSVGRFYFKKTRSGNLLGEYSNRSAEPTRAYAEAASRRPPPEDLTKTSESETAHEQPWVGEYITTWCEAPSHKSVSAKLTITPKDRSPNIFTLTWDDCSTKTRMFTGEAMLCDDLMTGDYTPGP